METQLWDYLRKRIDPATHLTRVENPVGPGTPDVSFANHRREGWLELKDRATLPEDFRLHPVFTRKTGLNKNQEIWIDERCKAGGCVWVVARVKKFILFIPGHQAGEFNNSSMVNLIAMSKAILYPRGGPDVNDVLQYHPLEITYSQKEDYTRAGFRELSRSPWDKASRRRVSKLPGIVHLRSR